MKKVLFIIVSLWFFAIIFSLESCHKDEKVDPCKALHQTSADFTIMEDHSNIVEDDKRWKYYACDTVSSGYTRFTAKDSLADSYEWHIGAGVYNKRSVSLFFPSTLIGQSIPITLIVTKKPNLNCFPKDNGIDTLTKNVYFLDACVNSLIQGKFFGYNDIAPKDTFSVNFDLCKYNQFNLEGCNISNLFRDRECSYSFYYNFYLGYKELYFSSGGSLCGSSGIGGTARIGPSKDQITIDYNYNPDLALNKILKFKFIGRRKK